MLERLQKSTLFRSIGVYGLGNLFAAAVPFGLLPYLTRALTPEDYGFVAMFAVLTTVAYPLCGLSMNEYLQVRYYKTSAHDFHKMKLKSLRIAAYSLCVVGAIFLAFHSGIASLSRFPESWLVLVVVTAGARVLNEILLSVWQVEDQPVRFISFQAVQTVLNLGLTLILVAGAALAWKGRVLAQGLTAIVGAVFAFCALRRFVDKKTYEGGEDWSASRSIEKDMLSYGLPLLPHALSSVVMDMTERVILTSVLGLAVTGVYAVGFQVSLIISLVGASMHKAWTPWLYSLLRRDTSMARKKIRLGMVAYAGIMICAVIFLVVGSHYALPFILGDGFDGALEYIVWIALGFAFNGLSHAILSVALFKGQGKSLSGVSFAVALIHIPLSYFLVQSFGAIGAAYSIALAYFLKMIGVSVVVAIGGGLVIAKT